MLNNMIKRNTFFSVHYSALVLESENRSEKVRKSGMLRSEIIYGALNIIILFYFAQMLRPTYLLFNPIDLYMSHYELLLTKPLLIRQTPKIYQ
jgi:hypothetical protein